MTEAEWDALVRSLPALEAQQSLRLAQVAVLPHVSNAARKRIVDGWEDVLRRWSLSGAVAQQATMTMHGLKHWMRRLFGRQVRG